MYTYVYRYVYTYMYMYIFMPGCRVSSVVPENRHSFLADSQKKLDNNGIHT